jgi:hypothetical protein
MIRDDQGAVKKAGAGSEPFLQHAFHAELLGCLEGLKMAAQLGMAHVVVEIDAQMVKGAVEVEDYQLSSMGGIITEIKHMKVMEFSSCCFSYCPRICNKLAHEFASLDCKLPGGVQTTWDIVPQSLEDMVSSDLAVTGEQ